jgi:hypothetical protein
MDHWTKKLEDFGACGEAIRWAATQPDPRTAWTNCRRADWMLWIAAKLLPRPLVVQAACDCAETALDFIKDGGTLTTAIFALHIAREWAEGREDVETVRAARYADAADAADAYAADAADAAAADAADAYAADAYAADAADAAADDAAADAYAAAAAAAYAAAAADAYAADAYAADAADAAAAAADARQKHHTRMCNLVRARIPAEMVSP